jgi:hypothetical protein
MMKLPEATEIDLYYDTEQRWLFNVDGTRSDLPADVYELAIEVLDRILELEGFTEEDADSVRVPIPADVIQAITKYESTFGMEDDE